jgi:hypothetical protein
VCIGSTDDSIVDGPNDIVSWPSLKHARFERVDAVLPNPAKESKGREAYFFSGNKYALIKINTGEHIAFLHNA